MKRGYPIICRDAWRCAVVLLFVTACLGGFVSCHRIGPTGHCWMGVDTLYSSAMPVTDTSDVRRAFQAYTAFVDTTDAVFPDSATKWEYRGSEYDKGYKGRRYWKVWFLSYRPQYAEPVLQCWIDVDGNGTVVAPLGCI